MPESEVFELSIDEAKELAKKFRATAGDQEVAVDPFDKTIAPSLLSADHIVEYVKETGLIAPFSSDTSKTGRLKKASYEGRLGSSAYYFEVPGGERGATGADPKPLGRNKTGNLVLPPNSIVFVQCDLEFRLPSFIALRFNLSISHVHRGLLLGTGPLVDPGFWGNLCIPIHNLTDEEYEIEPDDGLIWIEFTKTTSSTENGRLPSGDGSWDIKKFIEKAQKQVDPEKDRVGIRSGISKALADAEKAGALVSTAQDAATQASDNAKKAKQDLDASIKSSFFWGSIGVLFTIVTVVAAFITLTAMYYSDMNGQYDELRPAVSDLEEQLSNHMALVDEAAQTEAKGTIKKLSELVSDLQKSVSGLTDQLEAERTERKKVETEMRAAKKDSEQRLEVLRESVTNLCSSQENEELRKSCLSFLAEPN